MKKTLIQIQSEMADAYGGLLSALRRIDQRQRWLNSLAKMVAGCKRNPLLWCFVAILALCTLLLGPPVVLLFGFISISQSHTDRPRDEVGPRYDDKQAPTAEVCHTQEDKTFIAIPTNKNDDARNRREEKGR